MLKKLLSIFLIFSLNGIVGVAFNFGQQTNVVLSKSAEKIKKKVTQYKNEGDKKGKPLTIMAELSNGKKTGGQILGAGNDNFVVENGFNKEKTTINFSEVSKIYRTDKDPWVRGLGLIALAGIIIFFVAKGAKK